MLSVELTAGEDAIFKAMRKDTLLFVQEIGLGREDLKYCWFRVGYGIGKKLKTDDVLGLIAMGLFEEKERVFLKNSEYLIFVNYELSEAATLLE